jgi:hypothetical protein
MRRKTDIAVNFSSTFDLEILTTFCLLSTNNFDDPLILYPSELDIKVTKEYSTSALNLDILLNLDADGKLTIQVDFITNRLIPISALLTLPMQQYSILICV